MNKSILNSKLAYWVKGIYQIGIDKHEKLTANSAMDTEGFSEIIENAPPKSVCKIAFIVQGIAKFSGGITSVLRLGTYLEKYGHSISYLDYTNQNMAEIKNNAAFNLPSYKGTIKNYYKAGKEEYDVVIATSWESFYRLNKFRAYKMYFVQDYEPYFSKFNEKFLLAKKTYELGAHIVSLGSWNIEMIRKECNTTSKLDALSFPYEPNEYSLSVKRNYLSYAHKKCLKIAVYTKEEGKRIPNILQYILKKASEDFEKKGIRLDINFFGLKNNYAVSVGKNLGKLTKKQLVELYNNCDFGMCASMTNISLVPYEMLATGLPVIEFSDGSYSDFLPETSATLIDYNYHTLVMKLEELLKNPKIIEKQIEIGRTALEKLSWENTASEFDKILQSLLEK